MLSMIALDYMQAPTFGFTVGVLSVATVAVFPLIGKLGMNPILAVSLLAPLLPLTDAMGIPPVAMVAAITGAGRSAI